MAKKSKSSLIPLVCSECKRINYYTQKTAVLKEKLTLKKFCPHDRKMTAHTEGKLPPHKKAN